MKPTAAPLLAAAALLPAALLLAAAPARAQDYDRTGPYVGAAGSFALYAQVERDLGTVRSADVGDPLGANVRAGWRFHPNLAAEAQFEWLEQVDLKLFQSGIGTRKIRTLETFTATANLKAFYVAREFQPYALAGLGVQHTDVIGTPAGPPPPIGRGGVTRFALRLGGGVDYYLTGKWVLSAGGSYVLPIPDYGRVGLDYVSFDWGVQYRF